MAFVLAADPDTETSAFAIASDLEVVFVGVLRPGKRSVLEQIRMAAVFLESLFSKVKSDLISLAVVEGQEIYPGSEVNPNDLIKVAQVAGGICGVIRGLVPTIPQMVPLPMAWKGNVPKQIHQARAFSHYGIQYSKAPGYCYPSGCAVAAKIQGAAGLNKGDWKHVGDAMALALWGAKIKAAR